MGDLEPEPKRYRLYMDESGNHHASTGDSNRYLGILGCIIEQALYRQTLIPELIQIKREFFSDDPDTPVILHREDLVKRSGVFCTLEDTDHRLRFNKRIVTFYKTSEFRLICVVIDKSEHAKRRDDARKHPYHYCVECLLERYCFFLKARGGHGDVFVESRGKKEDRLLATEWERFISRGTGYLRPDRIKQLLSDENLNFRNKAANVPGLQLSDLLAHTAMADVLIAEGRQNGFSNSADDWVSRNSR